MPPPPERPVDPKRSQLADEMSIRLRTLRAKAGLTQDEVASRIGGHESAISRWENGSRLPSCHDLIELSRVYRVSCDTLLGLEVSYVAEGTALLDQALLDRLSRAETTEGFDSIVQERREHAVWIPIEPGSVVVPVADAVRRAAEVADQHPDSQHAGILFRPGRR